jgi:adenylate cyclase class IV
MKAIQTFLEIAFDLKMSVKKKPIIQNRGNFTIELDHLFWRDPHF